MPAILATDIRIVLLRDNATAPLVATEGAAGADLFAAIDQQVVIPPGERATVPLGIALEIPEGYEGQIRPRSGRLRREGLHIGHGTIDSDYRGEVSATAFNLSSGRDSRCRNIFIKPGDRIAQLVIAPVVRVRFVEVADVEELSETDRGDGGFGSTGR